METLETERVHPPWSRWEKLFTYARERGILLIPRAKSPWLQVIMVHGEGKLAKAGRWRHQGLPLSQDGCTPPGTVLQKPAFHWQSDGCFSRFGSFPEKVKCSTTHPSGTLVSRWSGPTKIHPQGKSGTDLSHARAFATLRRQISLLFVEWLSVRNVFTSSPYVPSAKMQILNAKQRIDWSNSLLL